MENDNPETDASIIPEEIITEILLRLPVKSLLRFKSVCKPWLLLISSSKFAKAHLKTSTAQNSGVSARENLIFGLITDNDRSLYTCPINSAIDGSVLADPLTGCLYSVDDNRDPIPFDAAPLDCPPLAPGIDLTMIGSCNGLVCFILSDSSNESSPKCSICLMNPATRKLKILPESDSSGNNLLYFLNSYSFGYDEVHDDFKVIEVNSFAIRSDQHETYAMIYSSRADSWKLLLNWPGGHVPEWVHPLVVEVKVFGGCLAICGVNRESIVVWVMKEYGVGESWAKVVEVALDFFELGFVWPRPVFVSEDARLMVINYGSSLKLYDSGNMGPHHFDTSIAIDATTYAESLCWLTLDEDDKGL
ncbi:Unknown protein [Striga hermonthica]|uniref:F-box domain-containing protein n=1 Tax=Striga hermonthica TaxID=68872 RepID=A0A9N7REJ7_STRHE|nr:Unknown protein [Striga hermonthica]